ncbi:hypothetical protein AcV5_006899 [Taiwanofungus camphoratus]|nr:hypothetical protein AcV5_006899 [Antrodia cinnamomea]
MTERAGGGRGSSFLSYSLLFLVFCLCSSLSFPSSSFPATSNSFWPGTLRRCPPATVSTNHINPWNAPPPPRGIATRPGAHPAGSRPFFLLLTMVFGGVSAMFYGGHHPTLSMDMFLRKVDMRTVFFATVFMIVLLVLAYLTNPSETSFRHYLTEQSFRQHLSRLDENSQDDHSDSEDSGVHYTVSRRPPPVSQKSGRDFDNNKPFHFVNRASISLRTPKHVFHSFSILTIAAVFPNSSQSRSAVHDAQGAASIAADSWFIGAFGKWWRCGTVRAWCHDALANTKDAERLSSGILDVKALDSLEGCDVPYKSVSTGLRLPTPETPPKSRGTERSAHRTTNSTPRSTTPPPLPKSASLPLHAPRLPSSASTPHKGERTPSQRHNHSPTQPQTPAPTDHVKLNTPPVLTYSPSPTSSFDQSPAIAELLRQISHSKSAVHELRAQLSDVRAGATASHTAIQSDLDVQRERKRTEDAARAELKTRTKALEDSKRVAEGGRRDAEKRLRAAESARDSASQRIERLGAEIGALRERMSEDEQATVRVKEEGDVAEKEMAEELERKRKEIKVAEDVVAALNVRAKELEGRIVQEEERLKHAKEQAELRKQDRSFYPLHVVTTVEEDEPSLWSPMTTYTQPLIQNPHTHINADFSRGSNAFPHILQAPPRRGSGSSGSGEARDLSISPRPKNLSLGGISNFRDRLHLNGSDSNSAVFLRPQGYSFLDGNSSVPLSTAQSHSSRFSPFGENDDPFIGGMQGGVAISPRSTSLIPSSLITSLEGGGSTEDVSRSFQTEGDDVLAPNWRDSHPPLPPVEHPATLASSPTSITHPSFDGVDKEDPFEIRPPPTLRHHLTPDAMDMQRAVFPSPNRTISEPQQVTREDDSGDRTNGAHRRWHSADPKEKKGLNPEAKVFRLTKQSLPSFSRPPQFDLSSQPTGMAPGVPSVITPPESDSLFSNINMRAFAPSPAEREALQRALGSSTNTSLERLPTLSEVSIASMPSSPSHVHSIASQRPSVGPVPETGSRTFLSPGLSWLQNLPRMKKSRFSPWEDEVPTEGSNGCNDK